MATASETELAWSLSHGVQGSAMSGGFQSDVPAEVGPRDTVLLLAVAVV